MSAWARLWGPLCLAMALAGAAPAQGPEDLRLKVMLDREDRLAESMEGLDKQIGEAVTRQREIRRRAATLEKALVDVSARLSALTARVEARRARMKRRLRARYRAGQAGLLKVLLSAESPTELVRRQRYLQRLVARDLALMKALAADERALDAATAERQDALDEQQSLGDELRRRAAELEAARRLKSRALDRLRRERRLMRQALRQQRRAQARISQTLAGREAKGDPPSSGFVAERGRLMWPVSGEVLRGFGLEVDPALGTRTESKGVEIAAPLETPVRAVYAGTVAYSGWYKGFGFLVILDHGDRHHSLYAHLGSVSQTRGARVEQGDIVGAVGDTASLKGPMLYFELREGGEALDPRAWLRPRP